MEKDSCPFSGKVCDSKDCESCCGNPFIKKPVRRCQQSDTSSLSDPQSELISHLHGLTNTLESLIAVLEYNLSSFIRLQKRVASDMNATSEKPFPSFASIMNDFEKYKEEDIGEAESDEDAPDTDDDDEGEYYDEETPEVVQQLMRMLQKSGQPYVFVLK